MFGLTFRVIGLWTLCMGLLGCPSPAPTSGAGANPVESSVAASDAPTADGPGAASQPASQPWVNASTTFVRQLDFLPPLEGPSPAPPFRWSPPPAAERCIYRLREVLNESIDGRLVAGHQLLMTYELSARAAEAGTVYTVTVKHVRAEGRRETYTAKLDSDRPGDRRRIEGGADTTVLFDMVVPFSLLDRPLTMTVGPEGEIIGVTGGEDVRAAMLAVHPPAPRASAHHRGRVATLLADERLAGYLLPLAGLTPTSAPQRAVRDEADYRAHVLRNARVRAAAGVVLWEQKEALGPHDDPSSVPPNPTGPRIALVDGKADITVEQEPGRACFRQAGLHRLTRHRWTGMVDETEVTLDRERQQTRVWVRGDD